LSSLLPSATPKGRQRFTTELVGGNDEKAIRLRIGHIDHTKISTTRCLAYRNPGSFLAWTVFVRSRYGLLDFLFGDAMPTDMSLSSHWIDVVTKPQPRAALPCLLPVNEESLW
jgi:hypothetical protein